MRYTTDKIGHGYEPVYDYLLTTISDNALEHLTVVEIGIASSEGLQMFAGKLAALEGDQPWRLIGIDNADHRVIAAREMSFTAYTADQTDPPQPWVGLVDLVVDDASHDPKLTIETLQTWWPSVRPGGYYVIEDWNHISEGQAYNILYHVGAMFGRHCDEMKTMVDEISILPCGLIVIRKAA